MNLSIYRDYRVLYANTKKEIGLIGDSAVRIHTLVRQFHTLNVFLFSESRSDLDGLESYVFFLATDTLKNSTLLMPNLYQIMHEMFVRLHERASDPETHQKIKQ